MKNAKSYGETFLRRSNASGPNSLNEYYITSGRDTYFFKLNEQTKQWEGKNQKDTNYADLATLKDPKISAIVSGLTKINSGDIPTAQAYENIGKAKDLGEIILAQEGQLVPQSSPPQYKVSESGTSLLFTYNADKREWRGKKDGETTDKTPKELAADPNLAPFKEVLGKLAGLNEGK